MHTFYGPLSLFLMKISLDPLDTPTFRNHSFYIPPMYQNPRSAPVWTVELNTFELVKLPKCNEHVVWWLFVFSSSKGVQKDLNYKFSYSPASSPSNNEHFLNWNKISLDEDLASFEP